LRGARALSTKPTVSASTTLLPATAICDLHAHANRLLATAAALAVCARPMTQRPLPFMPSPRPCAAMLCLQARVC
jgi:hypothetical protein